MPAGDPLPPPAPDARPAGAHHETTQRDTTRSVEGPVEASVEGSAVDESAVRPGALTSGWRLLTALVWVAMILAWAGVWNASVQLGLSTWWLGPRADPTPLVIRMVPFAVAVLLVLGAINATRYLPWAGLVGAAVFAGYAVVDIDRVPRIGWLELAIAAAAALATLASFSGMYRRARR